MGRRGAHHRWTVVDGHNLLYRDPELRRHLPDDPERARRALEDRLAGRGRLVLVYDGGPDGRRDRRRRHGIEILYSGAGSADDAIVAWLRDHPERSAVVVTADRELAARARAHGARVATTLAPAAGARGRATDSDGPDRGPPPPGEVEAWLRLFGESGPDA